MRGFPWWSSAGGLGSIPGQGTRSHVPQLKVHMLQLQSSRAAMKTEIPRATTKTCSAKQVNKYSTTWVDLETVIMR